MNALAPKKSTIIGNILSFFKIPDMKLDFMESIPFVAKRLPKPIAKKLELVVVDDSDKCPGVLHLAEDEVVTVIYDRESLDSLYGLAFFDFLYHGKVEAIPYHNTFGVKKEFKDSKAIYILGVEVNKEDLATISKFSDNINIFSYQGSFNYLYEPANVLAFGNVTLFRADNDMFIGGKNIAKLENSVAMMLKILFFSTQSWATWPLNKMAMIVGHAACFYENIGDYNLSKTNFKVNQVKGGSEFEVAKNWTGKYTPVLPQNTKASVDNLKDVLMFDLKTKLQAASINPQAIMSNVDPKFNIDEYRVYHQNIKLHIERTRREQGWMGRGIIIGNKVYAHCVPVMSFAINDIISVSNNNVETTVCVEDAGDCTIYYVLSKRPGYAAKVADAIHGENQWMQGNIICVSKRKGPQERR